MAFRRHPACRSPPSIPSTRGFYLALGSSAWVIYTWVTNHKRRGVAITGYGLARIRGRKVQLFRYKDMASAKSNSMGARGKRFTVGAGPRPRSRRSTNQPNQTAERSERRLTKT